MASWPNGIKLSVNPELPCTCDQFRLDIAYGISICSRDCNGENPRIQATFSNLNINIIIKMMVEPSGVRNTQTI
jgi:hypothetical protein